MKCVARLYALVVDGQAAQSKDNEDIKEFYLGLYKIGPKKELPGCKILQGKKAMARLTSKQNIMAHKSEPN